MKKKYVYILKTGGLSNMDGKYHYYDNQVFSSKNKALSKCKEELNYENAYDVKQNNFDDDPYQKEVIRIDFRCKSHDKLFEKALRFSIEKEQLF